MNLSKNYEKNLATNTGYWQQFWLLVRWNLFLIQRQNIGRALSGCLIGGLGIPLMLIFVLLLIHPGIPTTGNISTIALLFWLANFYTSLFGTVLVISLATIMIGSEYSLGTFRQMLTRGASRTQVFFAQIVAITCAILKSTIIAFALVALLGSAIGFLLKDTSLLNGTIWQEAFLCVFTQILRLLVFSYLTIFLTTLGRSAIVGIIGSLGYLLSESIITFILLSLASGVVSMQKNVLIIIAAILPGNSTFTLNQYFAQNLFPPSKGVSFVFFVGHNFTSLLNWPTALSIVFCYCVFAIGGSYILYRQRDLAG